MSAGVVGVLLLGLSFSAPGAQAQGSQGWSYKLWHELMSPFCPGRTLADCPSEQAEELREWIVVQEEQGRSKDEVAEQLYGRFGDVIRQAPSPWGVGLAAYVIPALAFLAGGALVVWFLRRQGRGPIVPETAGASPESDSELERLVDEEFGRSES